MANIVLLALDTRIVITSVTPSTFGDGDTGIVVAGQRFRATQSGGGVYLSASSLDADPATNGVAQNVTSWSTTSITFNANQGGLSAGTVYLYVVTSAGDWGTPFAVTLEATGGTIITRSLSENVTVTDSVPARSVEDYRLLLDISLDSFASNIYSASENYRLLQDSEISFTENLIRYLNPYRYLGESISVVDALASSIIGQGAIIDRSLTDSISINENIQRLLYTRRQFIENINTYDLGYFNKDVRRSVLDSINVSDNLSIRDIQVNRLLTDTISVFENSVRFLNITRYLLDSSSVSDALTASITAAGITIITRSLAEYTDVTDLRNSYLTSVRALFDNIEITETTSASILRFRLLFDEISILAESLVSSTVKNRGLTDTIDLVDSLYKVQRLVRNLVDETSTTDNIYSLLQVYLEAQVNIILALKDDPIRFGVSEDKIRFDLK